MRSRVLEILDELADTMQHMREEGEHDMRTVIHHIEEAKREIVREWAE